MFETNCLLSIIPISVMVVVFLGYICFNFGQSEMKKKRVTLTRKMAAQLWCIHVHINELLDGKKEVIVYKEKQLFDLLKGFGYDVEYYMDILTNQEVIDACEQVRPDGIGVLFMEEETLEDEEERDENVGPHGGKYYPDAGIDEPYSGAFH